MRWYKFHVGDYISHTAHLDPIEDIIYRRMMDYCYLNECHLPDSVDQIAKIIRMRTHEECIANVLHEFFSLDEYGWKNDRIIEEIEKCNDKSEKARAAADKKWSKTSVKAYADALQTQSECYATQDPRPKTQDLNKTLSSKHDEDRVPFQEIVDAYHKNLPELARVRHLTAKRRTAIKTCWNTKPNYQNMEFWNRYFQEVKKRDFLMGRRKDWKADFDFLITQGKFIKIIEGGYQ